jgi:hypothetical protein
MQIESQPRTDLARLREPFTPRDIEWKPGSITRDRKKGLAMAYITNRAIQERLDDVCGPENWRNEFRQGPEGGVLCGISIRITREDGSSEWVTKWDGAENTEFEAVKGGLSGSMKRAAVQWGLGRYLYELPAQWVPLDERGRFAETPRLPAQYVPRQPQASRQPAEAAVRQSRPAAGQKRTAAAPAAHGQGPF